MGKVGHFWLGHSSSKMVRHYFHLHDDERGPDEIPEI
jgi:hypothetical protein